MDVSDLFYFFLLGEGGVRGDREGGGGGFLLRVPRRPLGGLVSQKGVSGGNLGGGGGWQNIFFRGRSAPTLTQDKFDHDKGQKSAISGRRLHWRLSTGFFAFSPVFMCNLVRRAPQNLEKASKNPVEKIASNPVTSVAVMVFSAHVDGFFQVGFVNFGFGGGGGVEKGVLERGRGGVGEGQRKTKGQQLKGKIVS